MANSKETKSKKDKKNSFKTLKSELKKVIWPTPKQLINNTTAVLAIVIVITAIVFVLDIAFESANKYGIDRIKTLVSTNQTEETNTTENSVESEDTNANQTAENTVSEDTAADSATNETVENTTEQTNSAQ